MKGTTKIWNSIRFKDKHFYKVRKISVLCGFESLVNHTSDDIGRAILNSFLPFCRLPIDLSIFIIQSNLNSLNSLTLKGWGFTNVGKNFGLYLGAVSLLESYRIKSKFKFFIESLSVQFVYFVVLLKIVSYYFKEVFQFLCRELQLTHKNYSLAVFPRVS